jgi:hypothetical protein
MNEPPGLPSALGIEAVEWLGQGTDSLTVRVRGRWRRRRPTWSGQPLLVVESGGVRHRFPAMPEPPSLTGAAPGTWQMSFTVPAAVARPEGMRAWLQLGSVVVPLPVPVQSSTPSEPDDETLAQRRIRAAELAAEAAARRAADAEAEARELVEFGERLQREVETLQAALAVRERALRQAEQRAHAERALREELAEQLGAREAADEDEEAEGRIAELETELDELRRSLDEAEQVARAAAVARRRAEERVAELARPRRGVADEDVLGAEFETQARAAPSRTLKRAAVRVPEDAERLATERRLLARRRERTPAAAQLQALRQELEARVRTEAQLRGELAAVRGALASAPEGNQPLSATLGELRATLGELRRAVENERAGRETAERRVALAYEAIQEVRDELERIREARPVQRAAPAPPPPAGEAGSAAGAEPASAAGIEAERLAAALARLREQTPAAEERPAERPSPSRWLWRALIVLARQDVNSAASVIAAIEPMSSEDAAAVARVLAAGALRRRLRRGGARLRGRRGLLDHVSALERSTLRFSQLRVEPQPALALVAAMIDPRWIEGERFTVAYNGGPYLHVRGHDRPLVSDAAIGEVTVSIVCSPQLLPAVLSGERPAGTTIYGELAPLELLREWLERAQSG